jgi:hypothetical protein
MKLFIFSLLAFLSLPFICYSTLDSEELNGFLKDFARNKPLGYSIKHFTEKLLEEVMKLALRDTLLKSGNLNAVPTLKMVTLLDYPSLSDFFLKMNISSNLTEEDFDNMIKSSFGKTNSTALENEKNMDLFLSNLLKYISKSSFQEGLSSDPSKKKMYFYFYLVTKLKTLYLNESSNNISLASVLNNEKDLNLTEFIDYTLNFNSTDLPFSEYFDEENLKKPEYQNKTLKEFSKILHTYLKNGGKTAAMLQSQSTSGTDIWLIIVIGVIAITVFLLLVFFTKKYLKNRYASLNNEIYSSDKESNIMSAKT